MLILNTFINICGSSFSTALDRYNIKIENALIFHDELDLPLASIRFKNSIGHNGHNGIRNIIDNIGRGVFLKRIAVGIGRPKEKLEIVKYVLSKFSYLEKKKIYESIFPTIKNINQLIKNWDDF
ncbi:hypothetical protein RJT62_00860 [Buchnera aphidicola (Mindarus keteleerifoliae)]|uniref:hypothetical protein n=1 Tax=Buchnera aphidicola TaxID=9 RepID=UPI0031B67499